MSVTSTAGRVRADLVTVIDSPDLGNRSYVVSDGVRAAVIDPPRDFDRVLAVCARHGLTIDWVLETHLHNDYVSGGLHLARTVGARYGLSAAETVDYPRVALADGALLRVGEHLLRVRATPGHTPGHIAYQLDVEGVPRVLLSGGSLLFGAVGRTDLCGHERTRQLTLAQHRTVNALVRELPPDVAVHPTHGFGSACAAGRSGNWTSGTIGDESTRNPACTEPDAEAFAEQLLGGLGPAPRSYSRIGRLNRTAQPAIDLSPPQRVTAAAMRDDAERGAWVVDVRDRWLFTRGHVPGSISIPLQPGFSEWFGRVLPPEASVALVADSPEELEGSQRAVARLGVARPRQACVLSDAGALAPGLLRRQSVASFEDLARVLDRDDSDVVVLDVRQEHESADGYIDGAVRIPLDKVVAAPGLVPAGRVWVHCGAGFRAGLVASVLQREGRDTVVVDDAWEHASSTTVPLPIVNEAATPEGATTTASTTPTN